MAVESHFSLQVCKKRVSSILLKMKNGRDIIHFNADASKTELLFRIIHSVNQLSIYGAVSNWCEQFGLTEKKGQEKLKESVTKGVLSNVNSQEVRLLGSSPRPASANSKQENVHDFESLDEIIQFTRVCKDAWACSTQANFDLGQRPSST